jgi:hypothetical protein
MTPETYTSTGADDTIDVELHYEIKCRAYELFEGRHNGADANDLRDELRRVAYAAAQLQKYSHGEVGDTRGVRAARVYLHALSSLISEQRWIDRETRDAEICVADD